MEKHDWMPAGRAAILAMVARWITFLQANLARVHMPEEYFTEFQRVAAWAKDLFNLVNSKNTRTSPLVKECRAAFAQLKRMMRFVKKHYLLMPPLTLAEYLLLGFEDPDQPRTPHPTPTVIPIIDVDITTRRTHRVVVQNPQTGKKGKPPLVDGVAYARAVRRVDEPVSDPSKMPSVYFAGCLKKFIYDASQIGMVVDYACAYENEGGDRGPWSIVVSVPIA